MKELFIQAHEELIPICDRCGHWSIDCREIETLVSHFSHSRESESVCPDCLAEGPRPHGTHPNMGECGCDDCEAWDGLQEPNKKGPRKSP